MPGLSTPTGDTESASCSFPHCDYGGPGRAPGKEAELGVQRRPHLQPPTGPTPGIVSQGLGVCKAAGMQSSVHKWWEWEAVRHTIFFKPTSPPEKRKQRFFQMGYKQQRKKLHRLSSPSKGAKAGHSAPDRLPVPTQSVQPALPHLSARRAEGACSVGGSSGPDRRKQVLESLIWDSKHLSK